MDTRSELPHDHAANSLSRRGFLRWSASAAAVALGGPLLPAAERSPEARPNILLIVADDLGWADVGWHGGRFRTPVMDRLVREGVELDRHYVQPVCSPTRTALMSGRWTSRFGPHVLAPTNLRAFPPGTITLAGALQQCGYTTHLAGKWHLGSNPEWGPWHYGFDHSYGSLPGAVDPWTHQYRKGPWQSTWHRDGQRLDEEGNATELVAREAVKWIRQKRTPWFVYVPFHAVHIPIDTPPPYKRLYDGVTFDNDPEKDESLHRYAAFVSQLDAKVGEIVAAVEETGQRANTLIIFASDNGGLPSGGNPYVGNVPPTPALSSNAPLRGHKNQLYEGGVRVCAFANWKGRLAPGKVDAFIHAADWMPTITKLVGWTPPAPVTFDGRDVWPLLTDPSQKPEPRTIYIPVRGGAAVLHGGWKLIVRQQKQRETAELYDVVNDPSEKNDLAASQPQRVKQLQSILAGLRRDDLTELPADLRTEAPKDGFKI